MENRSLTSYTTQYSPTKSIWSTYLTCHSSAIYILIKELAYLYIIYVLYLFILAAACQLRIELYLLKSQTFKKALPTLSMGILPVARPACFGGYKDTINRVGYRYSGTDRNRDSFKKVPVFYRSVENRY